ncbi:hypothetical protein PV08_03892 [Exophiala spinifera]|uniref:Uncharacterized protein n=1 Tax=Exophiala spinifera TaxID=91928 RepID=A0A0D2BCJ9_9EURO|nr:uncharacterized protein PV08_03892 [Exophiala spinifera]KIW16703.1 hypothetical protein PV08_03892 [Exophiala spinifera]
MTDELSVKQNTGKRLNKEGKERRDRLPVDKYVTLNEFPVTKYTADDSEIIDTGLPKRPVLDDALAKSARVFRGAPSPCPFTGWRGGLGGRPHEGVFLQEELEHAEDDNGQAAGEQENTTTPVGNNADRGAGGATTTAGNDAGWGREMNGSITLQALSTDHNYKVVTFSPCAFPEVEGKHLDQQHFTRSDGHADQLLRWHFRQTVLTNMRGAGEPVFDHDFSPGSDIVGDILEGPRAGERMEFELFSRPGSQVELFPSHLELEGGESADEEEQQGEEQEEEVHDEESYKMA